MWYLETLDYNLPPLNFRVFTKQINRSVDVIFHAEEFVVDL